jgi:hypothetical protein
MIDWVIMVFNQRVSMRLTGFVAFAILHVGWLMSKQ